MIILPLLTTLLTSVQVYEEKEKTWERELKKIRDLYDSRLKGAQQKALKMEQSLTTQTYQVWKHSFSTDTHFHCINFQNSLFY